MPYEQRGGEYFDLSEALDSFGNYPIEFYVTLAIVGGFFLFLVIIMFILFKLFD